MSINDKIYRATDESLPSENWEYIIAACEAIVSAPKGSRGSAVQTIRARLESSAANTRLYSLTLLNALAQSGNSELNTLISSSETRRSLEKVAQTGNSSAKQQASDIIDSIAEAVGSAEFTEFTEQLKQKNAVQSPTDEDEQFQRALRLSMQDQQPKVVRKSAPVQSAESASNNSEVLQKINKPMPPTPQEIRRVKALYEYSSTTSGDLSFKPGQVITIIENSHKDWWKGTLDGKVGIFPENYVEYVREAAPTTEEEYIFAQAPNVEKLLSIFASASQHPGYSIVGNQDIESMYHEVLALRPQLIRMIDEYGARKQKLMQLNRDVVEARQQYEGLLSARISGPTTAGISQYSQVPNPDRPRQEYQPPPQQPYNPTKYQTLHQQSHPHQHQQFASPHQDPHTSSPRGEAIHSSAAGHAEPPDGPAAPAHSYPQQYSYVPVDRPTSTGGVYPEQRQGSHANPTSPAALRGPYSAPGTEIPTDASQNPGPTQRLAASAESPIQMPASPGYGNGGHARRASQTNSISSLPYPA